jgi:predicted metal-dependent phosphoesterase TrpH
MEFGQLHVHTRASDGDVTPDMILRAGLRFVGVTDHDTMEGYDAFHELGGSGIEIVRGVELTLTFKRRRVHMLVYAPETRRDFDACLAALQEQRRLRIAKIIRIMTDHGLRLEQLDRERRAIPTPRGLVEAALAEPANESVLRQLHIHDAKSFGRHFYKGGPADVKLEGLPAEEVLDLVAGILVLAHPGKSLRLPEEAPLVADLARAFPLAGIEVWTRKHRPEDEAVSARLAHDLGLVAVTSNDAHAESHLSCNRTTSRQLDLLRAKAHVVNA